MALRSDGTVVGWGTYGWSGRRTIVPAGLSGVTAISAGFDHSAALLSDGTVVSWDYEGQLTALPVSNVAAISSGFGLAALRTDGTLWGWGHETAANTNVAAVSVSDGGHVLVLKSNGTVVAWGYNDYGQTDVPPGLNGVIAISAGGACPFDCGGSSMALNRDGTVVAWGLSPNVPVGLTNVTAIAAGLHFSVVIIGRPPPGPTLQVKINGPELILSWSADYAGFTLQSTPQLTSSTTWVDITDAPETIGSDYVVTIPLSGNAMLYRLSKP
jgi:alpha-tubulin suppressor-like RCC1 family protein